MTDDIDVIREAESHITHAMITGELPHPRIRQTIERIDAGDYEDTLQRLERSLVGHEACSLQEAFIRSFIDIRKLSRMHIADAQILCMAFYRRTWSLLRRLDASVDLDHIREIPCRDAIHIAHGFTFGDPLARPDALPPWMRIHVLQRIQAMVEPACGDTGWDEMDPTIVRVPFIVPTSQRLDAVREGIRQSFFHQMYRVYFGPESVDDRMRRDHALVIDVLQEALDHAHIFPFLQGQRPEQVVFRVAQMAISLIILHATWLHIQPYQGSWRERMKAAGKMTPDMEGAAMVAMYSRFDTMASMIADHPDLIIPLRDYRPGTAIFSR
jgi:hypothetical protein